MNIAFYCAIDADPSDVRVLQQTLQLDVVERPPESGYSHLLKLDSKGLSLQRLQARLGEKHSYPLWVDFLDPALLYRLKTSGKNQGLAKAVGLNKHEAMQVLDATAGLGRDAFILASLGCRVTLLEQSALIYSLLADGLQRAEQSDSADIKAIIAGMELHHTSADDWFLAIQNGLKPRPDVIYLDPMFPPRNKSASVKKAMLLLQEVLGFAEDTDKLITAAQACARHRVVVKKPGSAGSKINKGLAAELKPSFIVPGKSAHFEVFV
tara:strand:- start:196263 stop:197060 length:798 start_codon:yes stop_codon:yes gene_type:complete